MSRRSRPAPISSTIASATSAARVGEPVSSATTRRRSPAALARSAAATIFVGKSPPGGPYSQAVRTIASDGPPTTSR